MTLDEIRKNKPDGATHYIDHVGVKYYKLDNLGVIHIYNKKSMEYECMYLHVNETVIKPLY